MQHIYNTTYKSLETKKVLNLPTSEEACVEFSDWTAVTVAVGVKMSCGERGTA